MSHLGDSLNSQSLPFVEQLYERFLRDPASVSAEWQSVFAATQGNGHARFGPSFTPRSLFDPAGGTGDGGAAAVATLQERIDALIRAFRVRGHRVARLDPLDLPRQSPPELEPAFHGINPEDMDRPVSSTIIHGTQSMTPRQIVERMKATYCRSIGVQYMHIDDLEVRRWLQRRMEPVENHLKLTRDEQLRILTRLTDATLFEEFIQKKFPGAKSFSLEGSESLIPLMDLAVEKAGEHGVQEIVIGMAHRGRLNVLANILGKSPAQIFAEFEDKAGADTPNTPTPPSPGPGGAGPGATRAAPGSAPSAGDRDQPRTDAPAGVPLASPGGAGPGANRGDVKYHLGYASNWATAAGQRVHLSLCFNPSHLEFVNAVALGRMRAKQDRVGDSQGRKGLVLLIHGDAAFAAEGVVQETLNLSELRGYSTGGTVHVVVNNQVGFTTDPDDARSGVYATGVAKLLQIPIFHVNGEDPEAVAQVIDLAMDFRRTFRCDVVIDMYCYRRRGHNEGDEPAFTQPLMYRVIETLKPVWEGYLDRLLAMGEVTREEAGQIARERRENLEYHLSAARGEAPPEKPSALLHRPHWGQQSASLDRIWAGYRGGRDGDVPEVETAIPEATLADLLQALARLPDGFQPHPKIQRLLDQRREMAAGKRPLDWATAETLALASLVDAGVPVRLSGQDSERGTFSQRHAVLHDVESGQRWCPLQHLSRKQARFEVINSPLSEAGVLGFEYGYSLDRPEGLILWEAQFGDFVNVAQPIIDQFLVSAEEKWRRLSGLTLLLPHGFEGMGPEHSSARPERFLEQCVDDNIQVAVPSTPAQYFHMLRRQALRPWRKPLIVMTPKSLLRHPRVVSTLAECAAGRFQRILPEDRERPKARKVLLCCGKVYWDLLLAREERKIEDVAILRFEQLYPLPEAMIEEALRPFPAEAPVVWVQEEPANMGAWRHFLGRFGGRIAGHALTHVARAPSASPATGSPRVHAMEQKQLIEEAFAHAR